MWGDLHTSSWDRRMWSAARLAGVSWESRASSCQAGHKEQASPFLQAQVCLQRGPLAVDHQINSGGPIWTPAKSLHQCLTLGELCLWSTSAYALTAAELLTLPLLLPCSRSKWWDQPSAGKNQQHPIHFFGAVLSHRIRPWSCQSVTSNHLAKENIILYCSGFSK